MKITTYSLFLALAMPWATASAHGILHTFHGNSTGDQFGLAVSDTGDIDGDGFDDFIIGAWGDNVSGVAVGSVRVHSGKDGSVLHVVHGDSDDDHVGSAVSDAGDVNTDGFDDFVAGAPFDGPVGPQSGSAMVFSGKDGSTLNTFTGHFKYDLFGWSVRDARHLQHQRRPTPDPVIATSDRPGGCSVPPCPRAP